MTIAKEVLDELLSSVENADDLLGLIEHDERKMHGGASARYKNISNIQLGIRIFPPTKQVISPLRFPRSC